MKMPDEPGGIEPRLSPGWVTAQERTGHLSAADLIATTPRTPKGYRVDAGSLHDVVHVRMRDEAGTPAEQGRATILGDASGVDRVVTAETHQRRGLDSFAMRTPADQPLARGTDTGVLGATHAGRAPYETLGWNKHSTIAECNYRP
ncbi:hypothetical protein K377_07285 [Streptomyces sp. PsTaAH-137]|nr:hypothetical protein K377_07285 [Streptomyces sp. PsTaAH-137]